MEKSMFLEDLFPELAAAFDVSTRAMKRWIAEIRIYEGWDIEYYRMANRYVLKGIEKDEKIHFFFLFHFLSPSGLLFVGISERIDSSQPFCLTIYLIIQS